MTNQNEETTIVKSHLCWAGREETCVRELMEKQTTSYNRSKAETDLKI